jgi:mannose-6-phosphate isomerase-like protein (cupin superfamily)
MIKSFKLPLAFDRDRLQADLVAVLQSKWNLHFNTEVYSGVWSGLALRTPEGDEHNIYPDPALNTEYHDTSFMQTCSYIQEVISSFQCPIKSVRFLRLEPGAVIKLHSDHTLSFEDGEARLHIPVMTNNLVEFTSDGLRLEMKEGECWYINASLPHSVANRGATDRIHLVIDAKVNNWLSEFFPIVAPILRHGMQSIRSEKDRHNMIEALQRLGTPAALEIIKQMESG